MRPFVKWAGGKRRLVKEIERRLPPCFASWNDVTYVEPFVGGGAVLFHMLKHHQNIGRALINDINRTLISTYKEIKDSPGGLIDLLMQLEHEYRSLSSEASRKEFYYGLRAAYNNAGITETEKVVYFIFLNHTCFNGLYRENKNGAFNVPYGGSHNHDVIYDPENLWQAHESLQKVEILCGDFSSVGMELKSEHVFFYLDPPYRPIKEKITMFTSYDRSGFNDEDQERLKRMCDIITSKGWKFMLSNSDSLDDTGNSYFEELYDAYFIRRIEVTRCINNYNAKERRPKEVLITNY